MPPRKGSKKAAGLTQPTLSFQTQRKTSLDSLKSKSTKSRSSSIPLSRSKLHSTLSDPLLEITESPSLLSEIDSGNDADEKAVKKNDDGNASAAVIKRKDLDGNGKEWNGLMKMAEKAMDGKPIHAGPETHTKVHHILRVFDLTAQYGPCIGMTRLQRWERAKKWGLNPPDEIYEILTTTQGVEDESYRENVLSAWV